MTTATTSVKDTQVLLESNPKRAELISYLKELKRDFGTLSRDQVLVILGQWFHPLHYFPVFLSRLISVSPHLEAQTFMSRILWQELGEGDPARAHERLYIETIRDSELDVPAMAEAVPSAATAELVDGYREASSDYLAGLGFLYGTEVVDLPMVSAVGELMRRCTGKRSLAWVSIHVQQEPHHVESSNDALTRDFTHEEQQRVVESAERLWTLWTNFFKSVRATLLD